MSSITDDEQVRSSLREREMKMERTINRLRFGVLAFFLCADLLELVVRGSLRGPAITLIGTGVAFFSAYSFAVEWLTRDRKYRPWLKYVSIAVDHTVLVGLALGYLRSGVDIGLPAGAVQALLASSVVLFTILGALRLGRATLVYSAVVGVLAAVIIALSGPLPLPNLALFASVIIVAAGVLTGAVSSRTAALFLRLRQRERLMRFLSRDLVDRIDAGAIPVELGGRTRTVTVLISDIRGFTSFSEALDPQAVVALLNEYFTRMTAIVYAQGGTVDKFMGDGLLAVFGTPVEHPDHAARALQAARAMLDQVELLNVELTRQRRAPLEIGIALHTGPAVCGIIGSPERMEYTVIGDTVNVTSRLEALNKEYGTRVIFTEETVAAAGLGVDARPLGEAALRGRAASLRIYTLAPGALDPRQAASGVK